MAQQPDPEQPRSGTLVRAGEALVERVLRVGIDGSGRWKSALDVAGPVPVGTAETERRIRELITSHRRVVAVGGFATGMGGLATLPVVLPADLASFYVVSARMTAGIARLRGYDPDSDHVRSTVLISLLGAQGTTVLSELGAQAGIRLATGALHRLPAATLVKINQAVGFRLITNAGQKGVINLGRVVPVIGGGVSAGVNAAGITVIAGYARQNFPQRSGPTRIP